MNILIITADDMAQRIQDGLDVFSRGLMPRVEQLISQGTMFQNAYVQGSQCLEVRGSFMFSQTPKCTNIIGKGFDRQTRFNLPIGSGPEAIAMNEWFNLNGYNTYGYGKNHHRDEDQEPGWDIYFDRRPGFPNDENQWPDTTGIPLPRNGYTTVHAQVGGSGLDFGTWPTLTENDIPDYTVVQQWISDLQNNFQGDWFSMVGLNYPHLPIYLPEPWASMYDNETIVTHPNDPSIPATLPCPSNLMYQDGFQVDYEADTGPEAELARREMMRWTMKGLTYVDHLIGQMLDALAASPFAQDTLIVFMSDHGRNFGEKKRWNKGDLWEQVANQFLLMHGPGIPAQQIDLPIEIVNIMPTLSDLAGIPQRDEQVGRIMTPLIMEGENSANWCDNGVGGQVSVNQFGDFCPGIQHDFLSYRKGDMKLIWYGTSDYVELYDLSVDPYEDNNLAASNVALVESMTEKLKKHHNCLYKPELNSPVCEPGLAQDVKLISRSSNCLCQVFVIDSLPTQGTLFDQQGGTALSVGDVVALDANELGCATLWYVPNNPGSTQTDSFDFSASDMGRPWNSSSSQVNFLPNYGKV